jgi:FkbM family methyltransferase
MNVIERQFKAAVDRLAQPPALKLLNPGVHRFAARWFARRREPAPRTTRLFFGTDMTVVLPEVISEAIYTYGLFDETVTWMAMQAVRPGDTVFDVGAHFGYFSLLFAALAGANGRVFSFEPTPSTFAILRQNAQRTANIEAVNRAAGDAPARVEIADFGLKHSAWNTLAVESRMPGVLAAESARRIMVESVRLDAFALERGLVPDFVKIDAENFEHAVVAGLAGLLDRAAPIVLLESGSPSALAAGQLLAVRGYRTVVSEGPGSLHPWQGPLEDANARFKDLLFVPPGRLAEFGNGARRAREAA